MNEPTPGPSKEGMKQDITLFPDAGRRFPSLEGAGVGFGPSAKFGAKEVSPHPMGERVAEGRVRGSFDVGS